MGRGVLTDTFFNGSALASRTRTECTNGSRCTHGLRRLPGGSQEAPWRLPGGSLEAPWRLPGGVQDALWRHPRGFYITGSLEAPRGPLEAPWGLPEALWRLPGGSLEQGTGAMAPVPICQL